MSSERKGSVIAIYTIDREGGHWPLLLQSYAKLLCLNICNSFQLNVSQVNLKRLVPVRKWFLWKKENWKTYKYPLRKDRWQSSGAILPNRVIPWLRNVQLCIPVAVKLFFKRKNEEKEKKNIMNMAPSRAYSTACHLLETLLYSLSAYE